MSKKKQKPILSDKIAELIAPRRLLDPEIDSEDETAARAIDYELDDDFDDTGAVSTLSDIRRKNVKLLHDVDVKYRGKVSSRKEMEMDSDESEKSDDNFSSNADVEQETNKSIGEFSMALTPKQRIKLAQDGDDDSENQLGNADSSDDEEDIKAFAQKLNSSKSEHQDSNDSYESDAIDRETVDKWEDDYEGEEIDEEAESTQESGDEQNSAEEADGEDEEEDEGGDEEFDSDEEESDFDGGDMLPSSKKEVSNKPDLTRILPKKQPDNQLNKGACVQNQLQVWEKLLEVRIHSQKMLIKANSLPQPEKFEQLTEKSAEFSELTNDTMDNLTTLVARMRDLQSLLLNQYPETKEMGLKRKPINFSKSHDPEAKRIRISDELDKDYSNFKDYQYSVISKWHDRTKVLTPGSIKTQKQQGNIDVLRKIEGVLANRGELIKKSQLIKGGYELFDKSTGIVEKSQIDDSINKEADDENNTEGDSIYSTEIYDDTDFYHTQLRELIEYKTSSSSSANEMAKQFAELQKLRKKMKKAVDTRASKRRKIRYVVHNKLVSFMAPNDPAKWTDEQRDELFKSLFGAQS